MITTVYFVRHAEADASVKNAPVRPLTAQGYQKAQALKAYFRSVPVTAVYASPFRRAVDTVLPLAESKKLPVITDDRLREWMGGRPFPQEMFFARIRRLFDLKTHAEGGCESVGALARRNFDCITQLLRRHAGGNIIVGTHALALCALLSRLDEGFGYAEFEKIAPVTPYIARVRFDGECYTDMRLTDPFGRPEEDERAHRVRTYDAGSLRGYRYVSVFTRSGGEWVYCRAGTRAVYETPGGRIEEGETPGTAAARRLYEKTGALDFSLTPLFDYAADSPGARANGQAFLADVSRFGPVPGAEEKEILRCDAYPERLLYPQILPILFSEALKRLKKP